MFDKGVANIESYKMMLKVSHNCYKKLLYFFLWQVNLVLISILAGADSIFKVMGSGVLNIWMECIPCHAAEPT